MTALETSLNSPAPVLLWVSSHATLAAEEIPLFLEAGYRVIPTYIDFWTFKYDPSLDEKLCGAWKKTIDLPEEKIARLQSLSICEEMGTKEFSSDDIRFLNDTVDVIYVTILPHLAIRLAEVFDGVVMFRPFGHGELNTYSNISKHFGVEPVRASSRPNLLWVPILPTLQEPEDIEICSNLALLSPFVSESRLLQAKWKGANSEACVVETIPRIKEQKYYLDIYNKYLSDYGDLPIKILGKNFPLGGDLDDARIVGSLGDKEYFESVANSRVSIYHGKSRFHLHYHPIEFMKIGLPVLFDSSCTLAEEGRLYGLKECELAEIGMFHDHNEAYRLASRAIEDADFAVRLSCLQKIFSEEIFSRKRAMAQVRWLKLRCNQIQVQMRRKRDITQVSEIDIASLNGSDGEFSDLPGALNAPHSDAVTFAEGNPPGDDFEVTVQHSSQKKHVSIRMKIKRECKRICKQFSLTK